MKKLFFSVILALLLAFTFTACGNNETPGGDGPGDNGGGTVQEGIVWSGVDDVTIARGDNFDLLAGVTATDGKDGDISDAIVVRDNDDFSSEYTGRYVIEYQVVNSEGIISRAERQVSVQVMHNVANGKFDTPSRSWSFDVPGGGGSNEIIDEEMHFTITDPGNQWWSVQFYQRNLYIDRGETYRLTFDAKSPDGHSVSAGFEEVNNNNRMMQYGTKVMRLTDEWQQYELIYTSDADVLDTKVVIYLGWQLPTDECSASDPHEVIIDNVYVEKIAVPENGPVFEGVEDAEIESGNHSFDAEAGVTCRDADGNEIPFTVSGVIPAYVQRECTYLVQYKATDAAGRQTSVLRNVLITLSTDYPYELINDDFSQGWTGWTREINQVLGTGRAEYSADADAGTVSVTVLDPSDTAHHIQIFQDSPQFAEGETYRLTVIAKASAARKIQIEVTDSDNDYANISMPLIAELTTEFQTFTIEFTADKDYEDVKVGALLGAIDGTPANITVTFDMFRIEKVG